MHLSTILHPLCLLLILQFPRFISPACPHNCNGHGDCVSPSSRCECWPQNEHAGTYWKGADCSLQSCFAGRAWHDAAIAEDRGHQKIECSARGTCDYNTGVCTCQEGFEGRGCERLSCPNGCSGHGTCMSLESLAHHQYMLYNLNWDHDKIYGCRCDPGFTGYDCSLHECPYGDDPMSGTQYDEIQTITCKSTTGTGGFQLIFKGETTKKLPSTATVDDVRHALHDLRTIGDVHVSIANDGSETGMLLCGLPDIPQRISPAATFSITFTHDAGDQPLIMLKPSGGLIMSIEETLMGTKEWLECSGRGLCDRTTGDCSCFSPFDSSDGNGQSGTRGDCGHVNNNPWKAPPVQIFPKLIHPALGNGFSVSRPVIPRTEAEQKAYDAAVAFAGPNTPNNALYYERSSKNRLTNCENDCNSNGACGTFTGTALSYQVTAHPTVPTLTKTEPSHKGDVPSVYTQPTSRTIGMPEIRRRTNVGNNNQDTGIHNMILVTDRALVRHAAVSQQIQIQGLSKTLVVEHPEYLQAVLGTMYGVASLEIVLGEITYKSNHKTHLNYRVMIQGLDIDNVETRIRAAKIRMTSAEKTLSIQATMATNVETAYNLMSSAEPNKCHVTGGGTNADCQGAIADAATCAAATTSGGGGVAVNACIFNPGQDTHVYIDFLTAPILDTKDSSPELFAALALGGSKFTCGACQCKCGDSFGGADCSVRSCPKGKSWFSLPTLDHFAHSPAVDKMVECSDAGICDELRGICECRTGFDGSACERLACPVNDNKECSGHGECLSMRMTAERHSIDMGLNEILYGKDPNNGESWDADSVYGCYCDLGFTGYDCSLRTCDQGDDPRTTGQKYEKQVFSCVHADSAAPDGISVSALDYTGTKVENLSPDAHTVDSSISFFRLTFRGKETRRIRSNATPNEVKAALEEMTTVGRVSVTFHTSSTVCASSSGSVVSIEFKTETGGSTFKDLTTRKFMPSPPPIRAGSEVVTVSLTFAEDLHPKSIGGVANVNSTRESNVCADRGTCNGNTGECECYDGFKRGSLHGTGACDEIQKHTALRGDNIDRRFDPNIPLARKISGEFTGT